MKVASDFKRMSFSVFFQALNYYKRPCRVKRRTQTQCPLSLSPKSLKHLTTQATGSWSQWILTDVLEKFWDC